MSTFPRTRRRLSRTRLQEHFSPIAMLTSMPMAGLRSPCNCKCTEAVGTWRLSRFSLSAPNCRQWQSLPLTQALRPTWRPTCTLRHGRCRAEGCVEQRCATMNNTAPSFVGPTGVGIWGALPQSARGASTEDQRCREGDSSEARRRRGSQSEPSADCSRKEYVTAWGSLAPWDVVVGFIKILECGPLRSQPGLGFVNANSVEVGARAT
ncbi:hypothetical protein B0H63DRAFT_137330 [Podospora didyma]|uniref:Uncharacterized protein n=1 Tax=Podospora didyma TaxID=330526 RepID=A0AAE0U0M4_9PEZI|nr:hypothetical protein B0H63DRAFT_137330 [Podospora didyma]